MCYTTFARKQCYKDDFHVLLIKKRSGWYPLRFSFAFAWPQLPSCFLPASHALMLLAITPRMTGSISVIKTSFMLPTSLPCQSRWMATHVLYHMLNKFTR